MQRGAESIESLGGPQVRVGRCGLQVGTILGAPLVRRPYTVHPFVPHLLHVGYFMLVSTNALRIITDTVPDDNYFKTHLVGRNLTNLSDVQFFGCIT
jgi:hypothetical protein